MAWTHRRMSLMATGSLSSPGSMGTPMYRSRSDVSNASSGASRSCWSGVVVTVSPALSRVGAGQPGFHQPHQLGVAHLGLAPGHRYLTIIEEKDVSGHLVAGHPLAEEILDLLGGGRRPFLEHDAQHHHLAQPGVGHADDPAQLHRLTGPQLHLQL